MSSSNDSLQARPNMEGVGLVGDGTGVATPDPTGTMASCSPSMEDVASAAATLNQSDRSDN